MNGKFMGADDTGAAISPCGRYRYALWRKWSDMGPLATFLMLNPSTADASENDATIRKCIGWLGRRDGWRRDR